MSYFTLLITFDCVRNMKTPILTQPTLTRGFLGLTYILFDVVTHISVAYEADITSHVMICDFTSRLSFGLLSSVFNLVIRNMTK